MLRIGREARLPVEITHIKMGSTSVWHQAAKRMPELFERARREGVDLKADVYPYTYWHSTIRVIVPDRDYFNPQKVEQALVENGGAQNIRIVNYAPEAALAGKTLAEIAAHWQVTPVEAYMRIVKATGGADGPNEQDVNVLGTSMSEDDVRWFIAHPEIMFCTDGALHGAHPRGAGSYPRILGHYVREEKAAAAGTGDPQDDGFAGRATSPHRSRPHRAGFRRRPGRVRSRHGDRPFDGRETGGAAARHSRRDGERRMGRA